MHKAAIIVFPATNCEEDTKRACQYFGFETDLIWHDDPITGNYDVIFLPGGFSYGDYISSGRLAKFSNAVKTLPVGKSLIVGICNGFQILCEAGLLEGTLTYNKNIKFLSEYCSLNFHNKDITIPIAHHQGNYIVKNKMSVRDKIFLTYNNNKNGSDMDIAGLYDRKKRIMGMMPHPERAVFEETGGIDGRLIFEFIKNECR